MAHSPHTMLFHSNSVDVAFAMLPPADTDQTCLHSHCIYAHLVSGRLVPRSGSAAATAARRGLDSLHRAAARAPPAAAPSGAPARHAACALLCAARQSWWRAWSGAGCQALLTALSCPARTEKCIVAPKCALNINLLLFKYTAKHARLQSIRLQNQ